ncbi:MAG: hypothetical protein AAB513_01210 [Patescibacteria group bacterium]
MQPLSRKKRVSYFLILTVIFFVVSPLLILYAKGYRPNFGEVFKVALTGGFYISADEAGVSIYVNDALVRKTNIVQKSIFVQDLKPGIYEIKASKDGQQSWVKFLRVFPELVTEARPFLLDNDTSMEEIPRFSNTNNATTTSLSTQIRNLEYENVNKIFTTVPVKATTTATTTQSVKSIRRVTIDNTFSRLRISWEGEVDFTPYYFCEDINCKKEIFVNTPSSVKSYDFFPGRDDLLIVKLSDGIYVIEIDDRSKQNIQKLVSGPDFDFKVVNGSELYLKNGTKIYSVSL